MPKFPEPLTGFRYFTAQLILSKPGRRFVNPWQMRFGYESDAWTWAENRAAALGQLVQRVEVYGIDLEDRAWARGPMTGEAILKDMAIKALEAERKKVVEVEAAP